MKLGRPAAAQPQHRNQERRLDFQRRSLLLRILTDLLPNATVL